MTKLLIILAVLSAILAFGATQEHPLKKLSDQGKIIFFKIFRPSELPNSPQPQPEEERPEDQPRKVFFKFENDNDDGNRGSDDGHRDNGQDEGRNKEEEGPRRIWVLKSSEGSEKDEPGTGTYILSVKPKN